MSELSQGKIKNITSRVTESIPSKCTCRISIINGSKGCMEVPKQPRLMLGKKCLSLNIDSGAIDKDNFHTAH